MPRNSYSSPTALKYPFSSAIHSCSRKCGLMTNLPIDAPSRRELHRFLPSRTIARQALCGSGVAEQFVNPTHLVGLRRIELDLEGAHPQQEAISGARFAAGQDPGNLAFPMRSPVRSRAVPVREAVLPGERPTRIHAAALAQHLRIGREMNDRASHEPRRLRMREVRVRPRRVAPI